MIPALERLGLSADEGRVYTALLELGGGVVSQIAKRAGKHRATCYYTLEGLAEQGLVSRGAKGSRIFYTAESPEKLVDEAKDKLRLAEELLPELRSLQNTLARKPRVRMFEGTDGVKALFEASLLAETEIRSYSDLAALADMFPLYFRKYSLERIKRRIHTRYICPSSGAARLALKQIMSTKNDRREFLEALFINPAQFPFRNEIAVFDSTVAIMSLAKRETLGLLIESSALAETMRSVFDLSWLGGTSFIAVS